MNLESKKLTKAIESKVDRSKWVKWKFSDLVENIVEKVTPKKSGLEAYIGLKHLDTGSLKIRRYGKCSEISGDKLKIYKGDLIFAKRNSYLKRVAIADFEAVASAHSLVLRAKSENVLPEFLPFFMMSEAFWIRAIEISVGSLSPTINWRVLAKQEFLLPPKEKQAELAELLWSMDEVIEKEGNLYNSINIAKNSFFENYLRQGLENETFKKVTVGDIAAPSKHSCVGGPFGSDLSGKHYVEEPGVPVIRGANLSSGEVEFIDEGFVYVSTDKAEKLSRNMAFRGDVVVTQRGTLGQVGIIPKNSKFERYVVSQSQMKLQVDANKAIPEFVYYYLLSSRSQHELTIATICTGIPHINLGIFKKMKILLPSLQSQKEIVNKIQHFEVALQSQRVQIMNSKSLQKSLINQVF